MALKTTNNESKKKEYVDRLLESAYQYERDIEEGKIEASKYIKLAIKRRKKFHEKYDFREEEVRKVFNFFYYIRISVSNKVQRFEPFAWMCWVVLNVYGYYLSERSDKRVFRYATIWVSRKSAKTTFAAILSLYALTKEDRSAEVYFCATTKDQASQALRYIKQIIADSPALVKRIRRLQYKVTFSTDAKGECTARPVANEPDKLDGLNPSFVIVDEKHAFPTNDMFNIMKTGMMARENPIIFTISTAGFDTEYPFYKEIEVAKKVMEGDVEDDSTFYALYALDDESEIEKPDMWIKSNPSLKDDNGYGTIWLDDLIRDYKKACLSYSDRRNFIVKNLNVFVDSEDTWIPDADYKECAKDFNVLDYVGKGIKVYLGLDLSRNIDFSSVVAVFEDPDSGKLMVVPEFYFPSKSEKKIRPSGIDLTEWIDKGFIMETDDKVVRPEFVFDRIKWWTENFDVVSLDYDPYAAFDLMAMIEENLFIDLKPFKQNATMYNFPMKQFETFIYDKQIIVPKNPVLRWNVKNVVLYTDGNGNIKPMKNKSLDSIDGVVAMLMAFSGYAEANYDALSALMNSLINNEE